MIDIESLVEIDIPGSQRRKSGQGFVIDCPFCGGRMKLNVNPHKNVWRCAKCDRSGGPVRLHAYVKDMSMNDASNDLNRIAAAQPAERNHRTRKSQKEIVPADIMIRNTVYTRLLDHLELKQIHRDNLLSRGLREQDIQVLGYKSYFDVNDTLKRSETAKQLIPDGFPIKAGYGIPGIRGIGSDSMTFVSKRDGFLIPVKTEKGYISSFQVRASEVSDDIPRYSWLSSSQYKDGCIFTGCETIHHAGNWLIDPLPHTIGLTEGALKADIASVLYDRIDPKAGPHLFLGLTGVNNISQLPDALRYCADRGTRRIGIFIDMDYRSKKEVADALNRILEIISSCRCPDGKPLQYQIMEWDEKYKGIDDYLLCVYQKVMCYLQ